MSHVPAIPLFVVGAVLINIGLFVAFSNPRSSANWFLAMFLGLVGGNFVANWFAEAFPPFLFIDGHYFGNATWRTVARVFLILDPAVLLYFVSIYPRRSFLARSRPLLIALAVFVVGMLAWLFADPRRALQGLAPITITITLFLVVAYLGSLALVIRNLRRAEFASTRRDLRILMAGLLAVVSPRIGLVPTDLSLFPYSNDAGAVVLRMAIAWTVFAVASWFALRGERVDERGQTVRWIGLAAAFVAMLSLFWVATIFVSPGVQLYNVTLSFLYAGRWIFFALLVGFAVARVGFLETDVRWIRSVVGPVPLLSGVVAFLALRGPLGDVGVHAIESGWTTADTLVLAAAATIGLAVGGAGRHLSLGGPGTDPGRENLGERKRTAYRALLEASLEAGAEPENARLEQHRRRLGLSRTDHLEALALVEAERTLQKLRGPEGALPPGFRLIEVFPSGPTTWTALAEREADRRLVVVKVLRPEWRTDERMVKTFLREGRLLARAHHPHVVEVLQTLESPPALVLEFAEGGSLAHRVQRQGPLKVEGVERLAHDLLEALEAVHGAGVIHRDVKPENVLFRTDGDALIADCGIARDVSPAATKVRLTAQGEQPGTVLYMAPEQVLGQAADERTDLYALGATLLFAAAGRHYLEGDQENEFEIKRRILEALPRLPSGLPVGLKRLVSACLLKERSERPKSAKAAKALLSR